MKRAILIGLTLLSLGTATFAQDGKGAMPPKIGGQQYTINELRQFEYGRYPKSIHWQRIARSLNMGFRQLGAKTVGKTFEIDLYAENGSGTYSCTIDTFTESTGRYALEELSSFASPPSVRTWINTEYNNNGVFTPFRREQADGERLLEVKLNGLNELFAGVDHRYAIQIAASKCSNVLWGMVTAPPEPTEVVEEQEEAQAPVVYTTFKKKEETKPNSVVFNNNVYHEDNEVDKKQPCTDCPKKGLGAGWIVAIILLGLGLALLGICLYMKSLKKPDSVVTNNNTNTTPQPDPLDGDGPGNVVGQERHAGPQTPKATYVAPEKHGLVIRLGSLFGF